MVVDSGKTFSDSGDSSRPTIAQTRDKAPSLLRHSLFSTILNFGVGLLPFAIPLSVVAGTQSALLDYGGDSWVGTWKVPFEVHIESRCPDARDCLQKLVVPTYWQVKDKVDFRISYVGEYVTSQIIICQPCRAWMLTATVHSGSGKSRGKK
jgi:hypothetical protein